MNISELDALLIELIINVIKKEREIEILRQYTNECDEFEPYAIFTRFDRKWKKIIDSSDIISFLEGNNIIPAEKNKLLINMFIEFYDLSFQKGLSFDEFLQFIVTKQHPIIRALATQRQTYIVNKDQFLSEKLENLLTKMINLELELIDFSDSKKINIQCEKVNYFELFLKLDSNQDAFIDMEDIDIFLRKRNIVLFQEEIMTLLLKYDTDNDKKLDFNEFLRFILPSSHTKVTNHTMIEEAIKKYQSLYYIQLRREQEAKNVNTLASSPERKSKKIHVENTLLNISPNHYLNESTKDKTLYTNYLPTKFSNHNSEYNLTNVSNNHVMNQNIKDTNVEKLVNDLYTQIKIDKELEKIKQEMTFIEEFNLISIFKHFDQRNADLLSHEDLVWGMNRLGFYPNEDEINIFVNKLDSKRSGLIKYSSFIELFIPKDNSFAKSLTRRSFFHLESCLVKLFNTFLRSENNALFIKRKLANDSSFNINKVFKYLDYQGNGFITMNEFFTAFSWFDLKIDIEDLLILMDRYDRNKDGKISCFEVHF